MSTATHQRSAIAPIGPISVRPSGHHDAWPSDEVGSGKPAPDVYLAAAERLGVEADDCVCLEDSGNGILAGVRAGMKVIAVPDPRYPPDAEVLARAHLVLGSLAELSFERSERLGAV